jgi:hypothetical protein
MRLGRLILVVATLVTILIFPLVARGAAQMLGMPDVYASAIGRDPAGVVYDDNDNNNDGSANNDNNDESDNEGEDNDNVECFLSLNSNEEVPCIFDNDNRGRGNDNGGRRMVTRQPRESVNRPTKCFDNREVGVIQVGTGNFDVTVQVMPHSSFGQTTRMTLRPLDPASVPAPPGSLVDRVVFQLDAQSDCTGVAIGMLPNWVNLGITYNVVPPVDKSRLQIVRLDGGSWTNIDTVPDPVPGNPYVSTTINRAGTYALMQR